MYRWLFRSLLFKLPPERVHAWVLACAGCICKVPVLRYLLHYCYTGATGGLGTRCFGLHFPNPLGLAAGMDKNGRYLWLWWVLGFGFVEVGTVTPHPQAGNQKPRLFRIPAKGALINRMGFNNAGMYALKKRLQHHRPPNMLLGINLGKQHDTPLQLAFQDYIACLKHLYEVADYFVINVSSPNTKGLRELQDPDALGRLLAPIQAFNQQQQPQPKPLLVKIAAELPKETLQELVAVCKKMDVAGIIAMNTSTRLREGLPPAEATLVGGISGRVLRKEGTHMMRALAAHAGTLPLIGVGGIDSPDAALERQTAGAHLIQLYTGLVYAGPSLVRRIKIALSRAKSSKS